ncbi:PREDICTED: uncharacterized protein LOC105598417 [Cercocebus atys]|uniref:uncharacterized protein LOC105598417 n=1 Tax=Cercocebus atys TaxID=9531 RepID=UPI0005F53FEB|nr:PREDICTED: uncharacterized protein LOC105598417 [Cercocebus atys]
MLHCVFRKVTNTNTVAGAAVEVLRLTAGRRRSRRLHSAETESHRLLADAESRPESPPSSAPKGFRCPGRAGPPGASRRRRSLQAAFNCAASANGNYCWARSKVNGGRRGPRQVAAVSSRLAPSFPRLRARRRPPLGSLASKERLSSLWGASAGGLRELGSRLGHLDGTGSRGERRGLAREEANRRRPTASGELSFTWSHPGQGLLLCCGVQCLPSLPHRPAAPGSRHASSGHTHTCRQRPPPLSCLLLFTRSGDLTHRSTGLSTGDGVLEHSLYPTPRASGKPGTGLGASLPSLRRLLPFFHFTKVLPRDEGCPTQHFQLQVPTSPLTP